LSGFLNYRLCGRHVDSIGSQVAYLPFDYKRHTWAGARDWKWEALKVRPDMLPELVRPGAVIGAITAAAAEATGIPEGTPLVAAAADKACEVIGAGGLAPHIACLSYGTTATINTTSKKYMEVTPLHTALSGGRSGRLQQRGADLSRLLDGQLVQGAVRASGADGRRAAGHDAGGDVRPVGEPGAAGVDGADAAALLESRHQAFRARKRRAR
jgi:sugar (pentulose or hexulose) kinase